MVHLTPHDFEELGERMTLTYGKGLQEKERTFCSFFGIDCRVVSDAWNIFFDIDNNSFFDKDRIQMLRNLKPVHVLWTLLFLKVYATEQVLSKSCRCTAKTFGKWIWIIILEMTNIGYLVVSFYINIFCS